MFYGVYYVTWPGESAVRRTATCFTELLSYMVWRACGPESRDVFYRVCYVFGLESHEMFMKFIANGPESRNMFCRVYCVSWPGEPAAWGAGHVLQSLLCLIGLESHWPGYIYK